MRYATRRRDSAAIQVPQPPRGSLRATRASTGGESKVGRRSPPDYAGQVARVLATAFVLFLAAPAQAAGPPAYVIHGDRSAGPLVVARTTVAGAVDEFGRPDARIAKPPYSCVVEWRRLRLTVSFLSFERKACMSGVAVVVTLTGRAMWRTAAGLRAGDSELRLRKLYPRASRRTGLASWSGYWLVTRRACETVGGHAYPGLLARVRAGRVTALVLAAGVCE